MVDLLDWSWLKDLPASWPVPDELKGPTRIHFDNELLGLLLAEYARFNNWVLAVGKKQLELRDLLGREVEMTHIVGRVYQAWVDFTQSVERHGGRMNDETDVKRLALTVALERAMAELAQLRSVPPGVVTP